MTQPTHQNALPLGTMLMEYRLESVLGAGGFGITYLARDINLDKNVAIKEYMPAAVVVRGTGGSIMPSNAGQEHDYRWGLERFIQEARTLAKFSHPHIVRVNRFFEANGTGYMVMDYEAGESLKAWLKRNPFPAEQALKGLLAPLLDGLEQVHAAGFLHRDIKPDNIFIRKDGGPVLIDFGSARQAVGGATQTLTTIVSPGYAPFEQFTTTAQQGPWSDIYALSGVLYFAVTGHNPPDAITRMKADTLLQGLGAARMRYSRPFIDSITWALAHDDAARPRHVTQWREALFGQRSCAPEVASPASSATAKTTPVGRPTVASSVAPLPRTERVQRAQGQSPVTVIVSRTEERKASPMRWVTFAIVALGVIALGMRSMSAREPAAGHATPRAAVTGTASADAPAMTATEASAVTGTEPARAAAAEPSAATPAQEAAPSAPSPVPAADSNVQPAAGKVTADQLVNEALSRVAERANERRPNPPSGSVAAGLGLTREEMAKSYPRLADHFDEIDADHDGRVSPQELVDALQGMSGQRHQALQ